MLSNSLEIGSNIGEKNAPSAVRPRLAENAEIRAGIVGAGLMGRWHAHALEKSGGKVVAVADSDAAKAKKFAAAYPHSESFENIENLLAKNNLDVLHICSPTASHEIIAEKAIESGVHLLIEKPLAATAGKTARLYKLASAHKTLLCPVHQFAFQNGVAKAEKSLSEIGQIVHLEAKICSAGGSGLAGAKLDQIAADILPHPLSLAQKFMKREISDADWKILRPAHGELRIFAELQKMSLSIFISMNSRPTLNLLQIFGTNGTIHLDLFHGFSFIETGKTSRLRKILHPFDFAARNFSAAAFNLTQRAVRRESAYPGLRQLIREFYKSIKNGSQPPITPTDAITVARVRDLLISKIDNN